MARLRRAAPVLVGLAVILAAVAAAMGAIAGFGTQWGWWHFAQGFGYLRWAGILGIAGGLVGLVAIVPAVLSRRWWLAVPAVAALAVGLTSVGIPAYYLSLARSLPLIHDISTDLDEPPPFVDVLPLRTGARNPPEYTGGATAEQQRGAYPAVQPAYFSDRPEAVLATAERVARGFGWDVVSVVPEDGRLEASDTTFWFGFTDDIVLRVREAKDGGTRLDVRSKSRVGLSDVGTNARRIRRFLAAMAGSGLKVADQPMGGW